MKQTHQVSESLPLVVLLTLSGGLMDAYSYICRGGVFANAQTGNIVLFGVNLSTGNWADARAYFLPVLSFAAGIVVCELLRTRLSQSGRLHWRQAVVLAEALILCGVALMPQSLNLAANSLTSFACGAQVEGFRKVNGSGVATTMCIGNLRIAMQSISDFYLSGSRTGLQQGLLYLGIIFIFLLGAVMGNVLIGLLHEKAILASTVLLFASFALMFRENKV